MIIIGERINSSRKSIAYAIETRNGEFIKEEAVRQAASGVDYIDINAGMSMEKEVEDLQWLAAIVQESTGKPLCIDTLNPEAAAAVLKLHKGKAILNSISAEPQRYRTMLPPIKEYGSYIVASCLDSSGIPEDAQGRLKVASRLIDGLTYDGVPMDSLFIDPLVQPVSVNNKSVLKVLECIGELKKRYPAAKTVCGVSNVSFGLPRRKKLNQVFMSLAMLSGLDAAIIDPLDAQLMDIIITTNALIGNDEYCTNYVQTWRKLRP